MNRLSLQISPVQIPLRAPVQMARAQVRSVTGIRLRVQGGGQAGWGEAVPVVGRGTETVEQITRLLQNRTEEGLPAPESVEAVRSEIAGLPEDAPAARYGLELALLDWLARRQGVPLAALLVDEPRSEVPVNVLLGGESEQAVVAEADRAVAAGFDTLKLKVGAHPLDDDLARLSAIRRRVGVGPRIRVDANGAWTEALAARALGELQRLEIELCEQPVAESALDALARLAALRLCAVAADESVPRLAALAASPAAAVRLWVLKPAALGGLLASLRIATEARGRGIECYVTAGWEGRVARMGALHLAAALPGADRAHGLATGEWMDGVEGEPRPVRGRAVLPRASGLGLEGLS